MIYTKTPKETHFKKKTKIEFLSASSMASLKPILERKHPQKPTPTASPSPFF